MLGGPETLEARDPRDPVAPIRAARGDPAIAELDYARGQALMGLGRLDEARAAFQAVIDARPGNELAAQAQLMRGETFFHEDRRHEALREFLQVDILYNAPRWQAAALLEAGKVYERLDQWADAAETYERLLARFPMDRTPRQPRARRGAAKRRTQRQSRRNEPCLKQSIRFLTEVRHVAGSLTLARTRPGWEA